MRTSSIFSNFLKACSFADQANGEKVMNYYHCRLMISINELVFINEVWTLVL